MIDNKENKCPYCKEPYKTQGYAIDLKTPLPAFICSNTKCKMAGSIQWVNPEVNYE